ncbi:hypothetical protein DFJ74DRAFT_704903 [Hyaloraphidium curvatum]|nr:hypothetical protein DFJ74DRAFT_704903 [Hyaloraphidium curvatum]
MVLAFFYVAAYVGAPFLALANAHRNLHGTNAAQLALSLFLCINVLICLWEMTLYISRERIRREYAGFKAKFGKRLPSPVFLFEHVAARDALGMEYWSLVWSTYSVIDPSYSDQTTFGFWVDVGNGFTTILPSIHLLLSMTFDLPAPFGLSARAAAMLNACVFWQELYGTLVYWSSYLGNRRYEGHGATNKWLVLLTNGVWLVFPGFGLWCCWQMARDGTWAVFRS